MYLKSIVSCVAQILPKAEHRHCARHIYANWHKTFNGDELKMLFWKAAKAWNVADYEQALEEMSQIDEAAVEGFKSYNQWVHNQCKDKTCYVHAGRHKNSCDAEAVCE